MHTNTCHRLVTEVRNTSSKQIFIILDHRSLQTRRLRYQLIMIFKLYKQMTDLDFNTFFEVSAHERTRGHKIKILPKFARNNYRLNFFTNSSVGLWNKLTNDDVSVNSLTQFKIKLDFFSVKTTCGSLLFPSFFLPSIQY